MAGLVTIEQLEARRVEFADPAEAQAAIDDASAAVRAYLTGVDFDALSEDALAAVRAVTVGIVRRLITNPRQVMQETLGDYSYSVGGTGGGSLRPTPTERKLLREAVGKLGAGALEMTAPMPLADAGTRWNDDLGLA